MGSNNKFSLSEDAQREALNCYGSVVEDINRATQKFIESVTELCMRVKYRPILEFTNVCINFYNDELVQEIKRNFLEWRESDGCLSAFMRNMDDEGEEAIQTAQRMEDGLEQEFDAQFRMIDAISIATPTPEIEEKDYETLAYEVKEYKDKVQDIYDSAISTIGSKSDDNNAYSTIKGVIAGTATGIMSSFEEVTKKVSELKDKFVEKTKKVTENAENAAKEIERAADSAARDLFNSLAGNLGGE